MNSQEKQKQKLSVTKNQLQDAETESTPNVICNEINQLKKGEHPEFNVEQ